MCEVNYDDSKVLKLKLKNVIMDAIDVYRKAFKTFISLSVIIFIINFIGNIIDYIKAESAVGYGLAVAYFFIRIASFLLTMLVSYRAEIAIYMLAERVADGKKALAKEVFERARDVLGRYIEVKIKYVSILSLPMGGIFASFILIKSYTIKYMLIVLLLIPLIYLGLKYMYAPISAILRYEEHEYFQSSKLLIKGDFLRVMFVVLILGIISFIPYQAYSHILFEYNKMTSLHKFIAASVNNFFEMFSTPFSYTVIVVMYLKLKRNKRI